jgi:Flp pilus assembly protein TadD
MSDEYAARVRMSDEYAALDTLVSAIKLMGDEGDVKAAVEALKRVASKALRNKRVRNADAAVIGEDF